MKQIVAIVKPFRAQAVIEAIGQFDLEAVLVHEAQGHGRQKDQLSHYGRSEFGKVYLPKIEIRALAPDERCDEIVEKIAEVAKTGRIGDGKILVFGIIDAYDV